MHSELKSHARISRRLRPTLILMILLGCAGLPMRARAHPADMYAQSQSITIARDGLHIDWKIVPGPILADAVWGATHSAPDGAIDPEAAKAWTAPYISGLVITLDDRALGGVQVQSVRWPESVDAMRTGEGAIEIRLLIGWPEKLDGKHSIELHNTYLEGNSLNTFLLTAEAAFAFQQPAQNNGQIHFDVYFPPSARRVLRRRLEMAPGSKPGPAVRQIFHLDLPTQSRR